MPLSHTITVQVAVPVTKVRRFMSDPRNYAQWAAVVPATYRQLDNGDWAAEVTFGGVRHIRFSPCHDEGIFDHAVFRPDEEPLWMPMRAQACGEGTEVSFTFIQRPDMSEEAFASTIESITTDLTMLKRVLEDRYGD